MGSDDETQTENLSTVGSGRIDSLFDDVEATIERLGEFPDELANVQRRISTWSTRNSAGCTRSSAI
jgi:hypothetical protein